ncbi:MAG: hypothetical protein RIR12_2543 [Bacteroidota bacterium]|jgi:hypothetical protein
MKNGHHTQALHQGSNENKAGGLIRQQITPSL